MASPFHYEPTIESWPRTHFGVWTPEGWRVHERCIAATSARRCALSGDGRSTRFSIDLKEALSTVHDAEDPTSDRGIYPAEIRVEHPVGRPRWAVSHTYLAYPHADQTLYVQEYLTSEERLETRFRRHVVLEEAVTDERDGMSVRVAHGPISRVVVGNKEYPLCNSAVRGVWTNPEKGGENLYLRLQQRLCRSLNAIYIPVRESPVVQCLGIWKAEERDYAAFDPEGRCINPERLMQNGIPLDCPKLGSVGYRAVRVPSRFYRGEVQQIAPEEVTIEAAWVDRLRASRDVLFEEHKVGFAGWGNWDHWTQIYGVAGHYAVHWDFNGNGMVDEEDEQTLLANVGRKVRPNYYTAAYFGNDWLSTGLLLAPEMHEQVPVIGAWQQGAGYDSAAGVVHLFETPGPGQRVFVEYHYDEPAAAGDENIRVSYRTHRAPQNRE